MLKIGQSDRFTYPVAVEIPVDGGKRQTHTFDAVFLRLDRERFQDVISRAQSGELDDVSLIRGVLLGWNGVLDEHGQPLEFSEHNRDLLLNAWPVLPAVVSAFIEANTPKGRAKN